MLDLEKPNWTHFFFNQQSLHIVVFCARRCAQQQGHKDENIKSFVLALEEIIV